MQHKKMCIDRLNSIFDNFNFIYCRAMKMKTVGVKALILKTIINIPNLKLTITVEYQNIKKRLQKVTNQIGQRNFMFLKKSKILFRGHKLLVISTVKKWLECFMKKNLKSQIKQTFLTLKT